MHDDLKLPKTRKEAKEYNSTYYFTGKPCKNGHVSKRKTCNGCCYECSKMMCMDHYYRNLEEQRERCRRWKEENRDHVLQYARDYGKEYYNNNCERLKRYQREYQKENRKIISIRSKRYRFKNRSKLNTKKKIYYKDNIDRISKYQREYRIENKDRLRKYDRERYLRNPTIYKVRSNKRRLAKIQRTPSWADEYKIRRIYEESEDATRSTGIMHHVDHIIPLQGETVCGLHVENNLRVIPAEKNMRKGNKLIEDEL